MTAEFPDTSLAELAERQAAAQREAEEFEGVSLAGLAAEIALREAALDDLRVRYFETELRIVERRLQALRSEMARRRQPPRAGANHDGPAGRPGRQSVPLSPPLLCH
jgi:hypothetical protein